MAEGDTTPNTSPYQGLADRAIHLAAVQEAVARTSTVVFTLSLAETWAASNQKRSAE